MSCGQGRVRWVLTEALYCPTRLMGRALGLTFPVDDEAALRACLVEQSKRVDLWQP